MIINLHIERLVLSGMQLESNHHRILQDRLTMELGSLLAKGGESSVVVQDRLVPRVSASKVNINASSTPTQLGQQIAQSVYGVIRSESSNHS